MDPRPGHDLEAGLAWIQQSPRDKGILRLIVVRPATNERTILSEVELSPEAGVHGDRWAQEPRTMLTSGRPDTDVQICLMNARAIESIAGTQERWAMAGDNLFVDLDLSTENLPPGQRLAVGSATIEVTAEPHLGCYKFAQRYGVDARRFVNSAVGKQLRLRGVHAKVVTAGVIAVGEEVHKI